MIYLILKLSLDPFENNSSEAFKYLPHTYVTSEEEAKKICEESRIYTQKDCWCIHSWMGEVRELIWKKIEKNDSN